MRLLFGLLCFLQWPRFQQCSDVFASVEHLLQLEEAEGYLKEALKNYIEDEEARLEVMEQLLEPIIMVHEREGANDTYEFVGHPLNAFHLIKRYITTWPQLYAALEDKDHLQDFKDIAQDFRDVFPQAQDYDGSLVALLRLQKVYGLSTMELSEGWLFHKRAAPLGHEHMYDLGVAAINQLHDYELAEEWMRTARNIERPPVANINTVDEQYRAIRDHNKERRKTEQPQPEAPTITKYKELCRKSLYAEYESPDSYKRGLYCYTLSTSLPYYFHKVEILHHEPEISLIHEFVSEREAEGCMDLAARTMVRAQVGLNEDAAASDVRVGKVAFLWDQTHRLVDRLGRRVSHLTGLNTTFPTGEPLQVVNYGMGGHYEAHYDFDAMREERETSSPEMLTVGDRMATLMIYLNGVELGGATVFPELDFFVRPVPRAAVFWFNYDSTGRGDFRTLHAACPVVIGQKWIANKWIRQYGQELVRPCTADENITGATAES
jgi:prolyl 4-hydroxylase